MAGRKKLPPKAVIFVVGVTVVLFFVDQEGSWIIQIISSLYIHTHTHTHTDHSPCNTRALPFTLSVSGQMITFEPLSGDKNVSDIFIYITVMLSRCMSVTERPVYCAVIP